MNDSNLCYSVSVRNQMNYWVKDKTIKIGNCSSKSQITTTNGKTTTLTPTGRGGCLATRIVADWFVYLRGMKVCHCVFRFLRCDLCFAVRLVWQQVFSVVLVILVMFPKLRSWLQTFGSVDGTAISRMKKWWSNEQWTNDESVPSVSTLTSWKLF